MLNLSHKNLDVWKNAMELVTEIYKLTEDFPRNELYSLTNQIRRCAISVPSNIAEGSSRKSSLERKRFYEISRSSLVELDTQINLAIRLKYLKEENIDNLQKLSNSVFAILSKFLK